MSVELFSKTGVAFRSASSPIEVIDAFAEAATVSDSMNARNRTMLRSWVARATIILAALTTCGATYVAWHRARHAPSPALEVRQRNVPPEVLEPVLSTGACWPVPQPEARELIDSLTRSTAVPRAIRVGIFNDKSCCDAPEPLARILESIPLCRWELVTPAGTQGQSNRLGRFDVLIFPGGGGHRQSNSLGHEGRRAVQDFVRSGGGYVGICAGAFLATAGYDWSLGLVNTRTLTGDREMPGVGIQPMAGRGGGTVRIELTGEGRAIFGDRPDRIDVLFSGGPVFLGPVRDDLPPCVPLAYFRTEVALYAPQRGTMIDTPSILAARFGSGRVVAISPHPEATSGLEYVVKRSVLATGANPAA